MFCNILKYNIYVKTLLITFKDLGSCGKEELKAKLYLKKLIDHRLSLRLTRSARRWVINFVIASSFLKNGYLAISIVNIYNIS